MYWNCGNKRLTLDKRPLVMGIVNCTPDSFSDQHHDKQQALDHAKELLRQGADILDIGGESTRPGSNPVSVDDELDRIVPVIRELKGITNVPIAVDTQKPEIAKAVIPLGVDIINHVSGSLDYGDMVPIIRDTNVGYLAMHMRARPKIMQQKTAYQDVVNEVTQALLTLKDNCIQGGIALDRLLFDPGIGFGKTTAQCLELMKSAPYMVQRLERPLLMGLSRKRWMKELLDLDLGERDPATATASALLPFPEIAIHRVHQVALTKQALQLKGSLENENWDWESPVFSVLNQ